MFGAFTRHYSFAVDVISGLDSVSSMEMLNVLRGLCNNGHLVIITTQALPGKTAELFNQLVLLSDKQVSEKGRLGTALALTPNRDREVLV